ncbi:MAG TPA: hypothetical protein VGE94_07585, partial [Chloroflexota bacterium]
RSEVCRLRLADVIEGDHMASSVTVHGKGDKDRRIEIWPESAGYVHQQDCVDSAARRSTFLYNRGKRTHRHQRLGVQIHLAQAER